MFSIVLDSMESISQKMSIKELLDILTDDIAFFQGLENLTLLKGLMVILVITIVILIWVYRNKKLTNEKSKEKIEIFKRNKKYIENLFVELNDSKECLRYFSYKKRWAHRIIRDFNNLFNDYNGEMLKEAFHSYDVKFEIDGIKDITKIISIMENTNNFIEKLHNREIDIPEKYSESLLKHQIFSNGYKEPIETLIKRAICCNSKYIVLTGSAGNGKTNLLCSFSEQVMRRKCRCIFLNGRDIENEIESYFWRQISVPKIIGDVEKRFGIVKLIWRIMVCLSLKPTFIVIDAINENNDKVFLKKLPAFLNELLSIHNINVIVACRSEYYELRYKDILENQINNRPCCVNLVEGEYNNAAIDRLFRVYSEEFNYKNEICYSVKKRLSEQLLLMRLFFETYQNSSIQINDLNIHQLYDQYITKISRGEKNKVNQYLNEIVAIMLKQKDYSTVDSSKISTENKNGYSLIEGNILVSQTLIRNPDSLLSEEIEAVYFVFDEMRDYCIAKYKMKQMQSGRSDGFPTNFQICKFIGELESEKAVCLEGVVNYIYREGKKRKNNELCSLLLNNYITSIEKTGYQYYTNDGLGRDMRLIFDSIEHLLPCEEDYIYNIMANGSYDACPSLFTYLVEQEINDGNNTLEIFLVCLKKATNTETLSAVIQRAISGWNDTHIKINDFEKIDRVLCSKEAERLKRFRKIEILTIGLLDWEGRDNLLSYIQNDEENIDELVNELVREYKLK